MTLLFIETKWTNRATHVIQLMLDNITPKQELLTIQTKRRKLFGTNFEVIIDNKIKPNISICM